jgi:hypothetical protein
MQRLVELTLKENFDLNKTNYVWGMCRTNEGSQLMQKSVFDSAEYHLTAALYLTDTGKYWVRFILSEF